MSVVSAFYVRNCAHSKYVRGCTDSVPYGDFWFSTFYKLQDYIIGNLYSKYVSEEHVGTKKEMVERARKERKWKSNSSVDEL